jgi:hypothetical protein
LFPEEASTAKELSIVHALYKLLSVMTVMLTVVVMNAWVRVMPRRRKGGGYTVQFFTDESWSAVVLFMFLFYLFHGFSSSLPH